MILREVTVGRGKDCDIYLDPGCKYASNHHATIYYDGNNLMFRDSSSNGTMINNIEVKQRAVMIHRGDIIMLAGRYQINWNQIDRFFPPENMNSSNIGYSNSANYVAQAPDPTPSNNNYTTAATPDLSKWNWGAFGLYPLWGFFNGCAWAILIAIFLGVFYPIPNIIFGVCGTRWAWNNKRWDSVSDFESTQHSWGVAGIIITVLNLLVVLFYISFFVSLLSVY